MSSSAEIPLAVPGAERHGPIMFDRDGGPDRILPPSPESTVVSNYRYDADMLAELRERKDIDIPQVVDGLVLHMASIWNKQRTMTTKETEAQTELAAHSMQDLMDYLDGQGMRLMLMRRNRNYNVPKGESLIKSVPLESITRKHRRMYVGDMLFREVCDAIAGNDEVKITDPSTGESVYRTRFEDVDFRMTQDAHLGRTERMARRFGVAPASGNAAIKLAFAEHP